MTLRARIEELRNEEAQFGRMYPSGFGLESRLWAAKLTAALALPDDPLDDAAAPMAEEPGCPTT